MHSLRYIFGSLGLSRSSFWGSCPLLSSHGFTHDFISFSFFGRRVRRHPVSSSRRNESFSPFRKHACRRYCVIHFLSNLLFAVGFIISSIFYFRVFIKEKIKCLFLLTKITILGGGKENWRRYPVRNDNNESR